MERQPTFLSAFPIVVLFRSRRHHPRLQAACFVSSPTMRRRRVQCVNSEVPGRSGRRERQAGRVLLHRRVRRHHGRHHDPVVLRRQRPGSSFLGLVSVGRRTFLTCTLSTFVLSYFRTHQYFRTFVTYFRSTFAQLSYIPCQHFVQRADPSAAAPRWR